MSNIVKIFDTTLRDGEQSPGASMNVAEKLRIATQLEKLGVDVIEAGFPAASDGDFAAVSQIAKKIKGCEVAALCRTTKGDIDLAWGAVCLATKPRIHTFIATSDLHLKYKLNMSKEEAVARAKWAVGYAKTLTDDVQFSAEDGSRSDRDFLCQIFQVAIEAGATTINLPDTVGYALPDEFGELVRYVIANTPGLRDGKVVFSVHCHNDLGLATANTLAAIKAGARQAEVTVNGIGERAGNCSMEEVIMALKTRFQVMPFNTGIDSTMFTAISHLVSMITGIVVQPNKAIVGANAFAHEAGIHQDGVLKNPMTYEIMTPESVGLKSNTLILGKHSGGNGLEYKLKAMGYELSNDQFQEVNRRIKALGEEKDVTDADVEAIILEHILKERGRYELDFLHVSTGTNIEPIADVTVLDNGKKVRGHANGNGPIDAAFNAVRKAIGIDFLVERWSVDALTGGTAAQGTARTTLIERGVTVTGTGSDSDIITASVRSFLNGINNSIGRAKMKPNRTEPVEGYTSLKRRRK